MHQDLIEQMLENPVCRFLSMLFVRLCGRSLMQIMTVAKAKGISVDAAADLLVRAGYDSLAEAGNPREDKAIPILMVRRHPVPVKDRSRDLEKTEARTGHPVELVDITDGRSYGGIPKTVEDMVLTGIFIGRFDDREAKQRSMALGLSQKSEDREKFLAEYDRIAKARKQAEEARVRDVAMFLIGAFEGLNVEHFSWLWPGMRKNRRNRRRMKKHPDAMGPSAKALDLKDAR